MTLKSGYVGISYSDDGRINKVEDDAQQSLKDAGISTDGNWRITKVGNKVYTKQLFRNNVNGGEDYILQLERRNFTVIINFLTFLLF